MALSPFFGRPTRSTGLSVWDPFAELSDPWIPVSRIWDSINDDFSASSALSSFSRDAHAVANTKVDWKETPESHVFTADLPGLKKEEVKVEVVDKGTLRISGERHREDVQENDRWHRMERSSGSFMRQFRLPDNVNSDAVSAKMENGVLVVTVPKANNNGGAVKAIDISA